ncbi:MAG TPA: replication endonuclease [Methylophilaceae bacterium]|jgi:hypothetical protein
MNLTNIRPHLALPVDASISEVLAARFEDDVSDWSFRRPILQSLPDSFSLKVANHYADLYKSEGRRSANLYMLDVKDDLSIESIKLASSDDDLIAYAKRAADHCMRLRYSTKSQGVAFHAITHFIRNCYKIDPKILNQQRNRKAPVTDAESITGKLNRLCNDGWWRKVFRRIHARNVEQHAIRAGYVHAKQGIYVSNETYHRYLQQQKRNMRTLEYCYAINQETGEEISLKELSEHSLANPSNRRAELMVRIKGFDELSKELGHISMFYTMTCPSKMHAYTYIKDTKTGKETVYRNKKYNQTTPQQAQKYLTRLWARIRAKLDRDGLEYYGFRVVEAHHDGTPHWHLLVFMKPEHEAAITAILRDYALREDSNESGAEKYRFKVEKIDPKKGSATSYIAKYITKGLDSYGLDEDLYGQDAKKTCHRVRAWASTWGVRQFQQIGGPPVTIYREIRRLKGEELEGIMGEICKAVDTGDWKSFVKLLGGPSLDRKDYIVTLAKQWSDKPNIYLEPTGYQVIGVDFGRVVITTGHYQWKIECRWSRDIDPPRGVSNDGISNENVTNEEAPRGGVAYDG